MKRSWFRIHLSTAIVLMFVAGGLIWANVSERTETFELPGPLKEASFAYFARGWPKSFHCELRDYPQNGFNEGLAKLVQRDSWYDLTMNIVVAISLLIICALLSEFIIRRRENRIAPPPPTSNK